MQSLFGFSKKGEAMGRKKEKKLFIALHEGHNLHELRARCGVSSCGMKPCLECEPLRAMTAE